MKFFRIIFVVAMTITAIGMLSSCANIHRKVMPGYTDSPQLENKSLAVIVNAGEINISNPASLNNDLGKGDVKALFISFLQQYLPGELSANSSFNQVELLMLPEKLEGLQETVLKISDKENMAIKLPKKGARYDVTASKADVVLFINKIETYEKISLAKVRMKRSLNYAFQYLFWDNNAGQIIAFGKGTASNSALFHMQKTTWNGALSLMGKQILKDSPFEKSM